MSQRPNILFLQVDQLAAAYLRTYGNAICRADNIEALAADGVVFERAYCNFPLCAPSRFSMATGQLCSTTGTYDNAAEMPATIPTYAHYLRTAGYQTALSGKMHFIGPDQFHGFENRLTADIYPADYAWVPNWGREDNPDVNDPRTLLTSGICERNVQIDYDEEVTFKAVQHLYDIARSNDARPFFLQVSYTHPHEPFLCKKEFWDLYEDADIPLPRVPRLGETEADPHSLRLMRDFGILDYEFDEAEVRRAIRAYYGSISYVDQLIGKVIAALRATGLDKNTAIVFTSDHGEMLGERGMWFKKSFYEPSARIPLIIQAPWIAPSRIEELVSLVDLLPTFMGLATGRDWDGAVEELEGMDLTALLAKQEPPSRTVYCEYLAEAIAAPIFMIRRGAYKFISSSTDPALLFDVEADPDERENLALQPQYAGLVAEFESEVRAKWNESELTERILLSQRRRRLIRQAMQNGQATRWNHDEAPGEQVRWYRSGGYNEWALSFLSAGDGAKGPPPPVRQR
ncbi:choline-sulfatase [Mesorhizobium sp. B3-1-6]|uniref:choline-sulfatase n=1 Tax=Mesorhizobium sp. B3-1-6 TaxID=2589895 RepID=UPI00112771AE|nr:choline-sulfatase [Mesorhizobium sp. B3-1-6]TPI35835.1 choline-sulfatase [Mesorhizobium sp. B3-1-6]